MTAVMQTRDHDEARSEAQDVLAHIRHTLGQLREEIGTPPPQLNHPPRLVIRSLRDKDRVQIYLPDFVVAGEGRCVCEAAADAFDQLAAQLDYALAHRDWATLPDPDHSLITKLYGLKTDFQLAAMGKLFGLVELVSFVGSKLSAESDLEQARKIKSSLATAF